MKCGCSNTRDAFLDHRSRTRKCQLHSYRIYSVRARSEPRASIAERGDSILSQPVKRLLGHPFTTRNNIVTHRLLTSSSNLHTNNLISNH